MRYRRLIRILLHLFWPCDDTFNDDIDEAPAPVTEPESKCKPSEKTLVYNSPEPEQKHEPKSELEKQYLSLLFEPQPLQHQLDDLTVYSASYFYSGMRAIIHRFKYEDARNLCLPLGRAMSMAFTRPDIDLLIPVPLHINSPRKYNQSYELAKGMSEVWGIEVSEAAEWTSEIEHRVGLNAQERMKLRAEDFRIIRDVEGLRIAVVDDVCTTGATLLRLSEALRNAGAVVVCAYALSKVTG